jgi:CubicO group peptidase (beta-lactamase class C family)
MAQNRQSAIARSLEPYDLAMAPVERVRENLAEVVRRWQRDRRVPSISAAVSRRGEPVLELAVGLARAEDGTAATPSTTYRIGSITKTFTAAAVLQLRDEGALDLDDELADHLPVARARGRTIRRLLAHRAGVQREPPGDVWVSLESPSREALLDAFAAAEQVLEPGLAWHYSNLAFALLSEIVARHDGLTPQEALTRRLLRPLGLAATTWEAGPHAAHGYLVDPFAERLDPEPDVDLRGMAGAGQLWSATADLLRWGAFLAEPDEDLLSRAATDEMHEVQGMADPWTWRLGWGLGLCLYRRGDRIFAGHGGGMPGQTSGLVWHRESGLVSAVLTNTESGADPEALALSLAERAIEGLEAVEPWRPDATPVPQELEGVGGRWWSEGMEFTFTVRDGRLEARRVAAPVDWPPAVFAPEGDDRYRTVSGRERGEALRIVRDGDGRVAEMYWATYVFTRAPRALGSPPT